MIDPGQHRFFITLTLSDLTLDGASAMVSDPAHYHQAYSAPDSEHSTSPSQFTSKSMPLPAKFINMNQKSVESGIISRAVPIFIHLQYSNKYLSPFMKDPVYVAGTPPSPMRSNATTAFLFGLGDMQGYYSQSPPEDVLVKVCPYAPHPRERILIHVTRLSERAAQLFGIGWTYTPPAAFESIICQAF